VHSIASIWTHVAWPATGLPRLCPFGTDKDVRTIYFIYGTVTRALVDADAALRADRQSGLDLGDRHRAVWRCILATKAEVVSLTRRFALELGQHGITVNAVAPGFVRTDMTQRGRGAADWPGTEERFAGRAMMGRVGEPEDIANTVVFLASPESGWITAQVLTVDGGRMDYIGHG